MAQIQHTPQPAHLAALESYFGHSSFRPMQWNIIRSIIEERRDNCVIMATGYGKSLTYQFPSVFLQRLTLVVSPLISLMEDQVLSLNLSNIPACLLGSAQRSNPVPDIVQGKFRVVYLTPEYVTGDAGRYLLQQVVDQLALIAIDEAHCLSKWGHDFRPAYRNLGVIRKICPSIPILAVTATATPNVREDIVASLGLRQAQVLCTGFDRPNLELHVKLKSSLGAWEDLRGPLGRNTEGSVIIYCLTRKQTEEIVELLKSMKIDCEAYHAGLSINQRRDVHERFVRDRIQIIVATIAFGMGIDKPDVRLVIHYGASKDLESYYQEAGRAGRDGQPSKCLMFWSRADFRTHEMLRELSNTGCKQNLEALSKRMHEYLDTRDCRRRFILKYFEGDKVSLELAARKNCCDNCDRTAGGVKDSERYDGIDEQGNYDFSKDAEQLLKAVDAFGGGTGITLPIALLRGSKGKKLSDYHQRNPLHGVGKSKDEEWWKALAALLERECFLSKVKMPNPFSKFAPIVKISLTPKAKKWLETPNRKLLMKPTTEMFKSIRLTRVQPLFDTTSDFQSQQQTVPKFASEKPGSSRILEPVSQRQDLVQELVKTLLKKRSELATAYECMPYMIASNQALHQMASIRPLNLDEMKAAKLDGFSDIKVQKFGKDFLTCIQQKLNYLPRPTTGKLTLQQALLEHPLSKTKFSSTHQTTWNLWLEGRSLADIAKFRGIVESTVAAHLCEAIKHGFPFDWKQFARLDIDRGLYEHVKSNLPPSLEGVKLTEIKNFCLPHVTFDQIKLVLNHVHVRRHLNALNVPFEEDCAAVAAPATVPSAKRVEPPKPAVSTVSNECDDFWDDDDDVAESSFAEIDRICEEAGCSQKENKKPVEHISIEDDDDDDDAGIDLEEIAALEKAVINCTPKEKSLPAVSVPTKRIVYEESDSDEEARTSQRQKGPSPAKQAKVKQQPDPPGNIFRFKTGSNRLANRRIAYEDDGSDEDSNDAVSVPLPKRTV